MASDMTKLCGLWLGKTKAGAGYMSGSDKQKGVKFLVFKNDRKSKPTDPDYVLYQAPLQGGAQPAQARPADDGFETADNDLF